MSTAITKQVPLTLPGWAILPRRMQGGATMTMIGAAPLNQQRLKQCPDNVSLLPLSTKTLNQYLDIDGHRNNGKERNEQQQHSMMTRTFLTQRWWMGQPPTLALEHAGTESHWLCHDLIRCRCPIVGTTIVAMLMEITLMVIWRMITCPSAR